MGSAQITLPKVSTGFKPVDDFLNSSGTKSLADATNLYFDVVKQFKEPEVNGKCTPCMILSTLRSRLFSFGAVRKMKCLQDWKWRAVDQKVLWECKEGDVIEMSDMHPIYNLVFSLIKAKILEEENA